FGLLRLHPLVLHAGQSGRTRSGEGNERATVAYWPHAARSNLRFRTRAPHAPLNRHRRGSLLSHLNDRMGTLRTSISTRPNATSAGACCAASSFVSFKPEALARMTRRRAPLLPPRLRGERFPQRRPPCKPRRSDLSVLTPGSLAPR